VHDNMVLAQRVGPAPRCRFHPAQPGRLPRTNRAAGCGLPGPLPTPAPAPPCPRQADCLPWDDWVFGSKAAQAAELASWLWWLSTAPDGGGIVTENQRAWGGH
jgi:hypothetical protein